MRKDPKTGQTTADPNISNTEGMSALAYALKTDNQEIVDKLCEVTTENIDSCITLLSQNKKLKIENKNGLELFVKRILNDRKHSLLLKKGSFFGHDKLLKYLFFNCSIKWIRNDVVDALKNAIMVDNADCVKIIKDFWKQKKLK